MKIKLFSTDKTERKQSFAYKMQMIAFQMQSFAQMNHDILRNDQKWPTTSLKDKAFLCQKW